MTRRGIRALGVAGVLVAAAWGAIRPARAFPPERPYDPRPATAEAEKKLTEDKFSFLVMGDLRPGRDFPKFIKLAESLQPTFVLLTGDMVESGLPGCYDDLERYLGPFMRKFPTWPCVGNHELARVEGWGLYKRFYGITTWRHSFDFRNARFVYVNAPGSFNEKELQWVQEQFSEARKAGRLLFAWQHCPFYTVGQKRPREVPGQPTAFTRLCTQYGVVADFAGHEHIYYRTFRDGVTYITQAAGSGKIYYLNRRSEAVQGDVFYGSLPKTGTLLHTPAGEKTYPGPVMMLTQIIVDGGKVAGKTFAATGEGIDEFVLSPPPTTQPAPPAQPKPAGSSATTRPAATPG